MKTWPKRLTITVTAEDAADGRRGSCDSCPVALALTRTYPGVYWRAGVATAMARREEGRDVWYRYSERLAWDVCDFDNECGAFPPGTYRLTRMSL